MCVNLQAAMENSTEKCEKLTPFGHCFEQVRIILQKKLTMTCQAAAKDSTESVFFCTVR